MTDTKGKKVSGKGFFFNNRQTLILLGAVILGGLLGFFHLIPQFILNDYFRPLGEMFIGIFKFIVPIIIFPTLVITVVEQMSKGKLNKIFKWLAVGLIGMIIISVAVGMFASSIVPLVDPSEAEMIKSEYMVNGDEAETTAEIGIFERILTAFYVDDFFKILSIDNLLAMIIVSILAGITLGIVKRKQDTAYENYVAKGEIEDKPGDGANVIINVLSTIKDGIFIVLNFIMTWIAPICLGCYFAYMIDSLGGGIAKGFLLTFLLYLLAVVAIYIVYNIIAFAVGGVEGWKRFMKGSMAVIATAAATCSSSACIPVNLDQTKKIGVSNPVASSVIPFGVVFHKDGSAIGAVFKIMFLVCIFGTMGHNMAEVILIAIVANLLIAAVPIGGGTISEMFIITSMGYNPLVLPILIIIATIIDIPATILNVLGDMLLSMFVERRVNGKDWLKKGENVA